MTVFPVQITQVSDGNNDPELRNSGIDMRTDVTLYADGSLRAITETQDHTEFTGGHGAVVILAYDAGQTRIWASDPQRYWVDARAIGTSDRTDTYNAAIDPNTLARIAYLAIHHYSAPNDAFQDLQNWLAGAETIGGEVVQIVQDIRNLTGSNSTSSGSTTGTSGQGLTSREPMMVVSYSPQGPFANGATVALKLAAVDPSQPSVDLNAEVVLDGVDTHHTTGVAPVNLTLRKQFEQIDTSVVHGRSRPVAVNPVLTLSKKGYQDAEIELPVR